MKYTTFFCTNIDCRVKLCISFKTFVKDIRDRILICPLCGYKSLIAPDSPDEQIEYFKFDIKDKGGEGDLDGSGD
jgi:ATP-dependent RNA circularization protein (DNA/RNA ligase family)